jgi:selenocysteine lyase/cysteine desulfurase
MTAGQTGIPQKSFGTEKSTRKKNPMNKKRIYLDHSATTPMAPEAVAAMQPYLSDIFGNDTMTIVDVSLRR